MSSTNCLSLQSTSMESLRGSCCSSLKPKPTSGIVRSYASNINPSNRRWQNTKHAAGRETIKGLLRCRQLQEVAKKSQRATVARASNAAVEATEAEKEAWAKRKSESEESGAAPPDEWRWTLNWDAITERILIGSCPRSPGDIDRLVEEAQVSAILNLQSDICIEAMQIPLAAIQQQAARRRLVLNRVPTRDFDHGDQVLMLPESVRVLNRLLADGHRVYVHCTAGINRACLAVVAYLTFVQGLQKHEALAMVKNSRSIANPYMDCLSEAKRRLLEGRQEEMTVLATEVYNQRQAGAGSGCASSDWSSAQTIALSRTFGRYLEVDLGMVQLTRDLVEQQQRASKEESDTISRLTKEVEEAEGELEVQQSLMSKLRGAAAASSEAVEETSKTAEELRGKVKQQQLIIERQQVDIQWLQQQLSEGKSRSSLGALETSEMEADGRGSLSAGKVPANGIATNGYAGKSVPSSNGVHFNVQPLNGHGGGGSEEGNEDGSDTHGSNGSVADPAVASSVASWDHGDDTFSQVDAASVVEEEAHDAIEESHEDMECDVVTRTCSSSDHE